MERILNLTVDSVFSGRTILELLRSHYKMSGTLIKALKKEADGIEVNGERRFVNYILSEGEELRVCMRERAPENILPVKLDFKTVYEDEDIIIVSKPPHMPTHQSLGNYENTLANALMYHFRENGCECAFHAVNRLDKDTSGLMAVAKNSHCHARLCADIKAGNLTKRYRAIVCGKTADRGIVDMPIKREEGSCIKRCAALDGKRAVTEFFRMQTNGKYSLLELEPKTGRTHQIRVHMAYIGHPLLGDWLYGDENKALFSRHALHSSYLSLTHPITGEKMEFFDDLADDINEFLQKQDGFFM